MIIVNRNNFEKEVENSRTPVIVFFISGNCRICNLMRPELEEMESEYSDKLSVAEIEIKGNSDLAEKYSIISTPTILIFNSGKPIAQFIGYTSQHDLREKIEEQLKNIA